VCTASYVHRARSPTMYRTTHDTSLARRRRPTGERRS